MAKKKQRTDPWDVLRAMGIMRRKKDPKRKPRGDKPTTVGVRG